MKFPQQAFDVQQNAGGGQLSVRRIVTNNPPDSPFTPTADDYGCFGWTVDPADVLTSAQTLTSGVLFGALLVIPNTVTANRLSLSYHTVQGTQTNFNGVGLYSLNSALTTATKIAASATQTWTTGGNVDKVVDAPFVTPTQLIPGYYIAAVLGSTSGTAMTVHGALGAVAAVMNFTKNSGVSQYRTFTSGSGLTALPATITMSGVTAGAFLPFLALS